MREVDSLTMNEISTKNRTKLFIQLKIEKLEKRKKNLKKKNHHNRK